MITPGPSGAEKAGRPVVLVVAVPYVLATALAFELGKRNTFEVVAPDFDAGEVAPSRRWDAVVTSLPMGPSTSGMLIELPESFQDPVMVTFDQMTVPVKVSGTTPIEDIMSLLERHLLVHGGPSASRQDRPGSGAVPARSPTLAHVALPLNRWT